MYKICSVVFRVKVHSTQESTQFIYLFIYRRLIAQSTGQGHLRESGQGLIIHDNAQGFQLLRTKYFSTKVRRSCVTE